jgi:PEP-CTERM motif
MAILRFDKEVQVFIRIRTLAFAAATLMSALCPMVKADTIVTPNNNGVLIVPDGSLITAMFFTPPGGSLSGFYTIDFQFQNGYGYARGDYNDGDNGVITFTNPVSNLSVNWEATGSEFSMFAATNPGGSLYRCDPLPCPTQASFPGPGITSLSWQNDKGFSGIDSLTYTVTASPEPSSLLLLGSGLMALVGLFRRKVSVYT